MKDGFDIFDATTPPDFQQVRTLFQEYAHSLGWDISSGGRLADEMANLPGPYAQPAGALLLACVDGVPAGVLGLEPIPPEARIEGIDAEHLGELKRLFVREAYRRRGIAKALMERSAQEARAKGYRTLVLTTSAEMMPLAQHLYQTLGYRETQPYRNDMNWPDVRWLRLDL